MFLSDYYFAIFSFHIFNNLPYITLTFLGGEVHRVTLDSIQNFHLEKKLAKSLIIQENKKYYIFF